MEEQFKTCLQQCYSCLVKVWSREEKGVTTERQINVIFKENNAHEERAFMKSAASQIKDGNVYDEKQLTLHFPDILASHFLSIIIFIVFVLELGLSWIYLKQTVK